jgi:prolyl-tRNA synthetase
MRGREFTMKDAYSFDRDLAASAHEELPGHVRAYKRIFDRFGLHLPRGGGRHRRHRRRCSHEFQVIADTGEDAIVYCPTSDYAANIELAEAVPLPAAARARPRRPLAKTPTPGKSTCEDVATLLGLPLRTPSSRWCWPPTRPTSRRDRQDHRLAAAGARRPQPQRDQGRQGAGAEGRLPLCHRGRDRGPLRLQAGLPGPDRHAQAGQVVADRTVAHDDFVCGANEADFHLTGVNWGRDLPEPDLVADIRNVVAGDPSPDGKGVLAIQRGIEVGHVFYLGTKKYSEAMNANFLDENGKPQP